jgi:cell wall-associated NlpC family hydrolase
VTDLAQPAADVVREARTFIGTPWVHQGRSRQGLDCLGLASLVARNTRGYTFDVLNYQAQATDETMLQLCRQHMLPVPAVARQPGDVVVIRYGNQRHMAIVGDHPVVGELTLIHASSVHGRVVEHRLDSRWARICIGTFRLYDHRGGG